jgi:hypothetical protein
MATHSGFETRSFDLPPTRLVLSLLDPPQVIVNGKAMVGLKAQKALALRCELNQPNLVTEPPTGLARVALAQGALIQAQTQVEEILYYLENGGLDGTECPFQVYLTCYHVLKAKQDPRAQEILATAYGLLQERAAKITDEGMRRSFLENVTAHREIMRQVEAHRLAT